MYTKSNSSVFNTNTMKRQTKFYVPNEGGVAKNVEWSIIESVGFKEHIPIPRDTQAEEEKVVWRGELKKRGAVDEFRDWRWGLVNGVITDDGVFRWYTVSDRDTAYPVGEVNLLDTDTDIRFKGNQFTLSSFTQYTEYVFLIENVNCVRQCYRALRNPLYAPLNYGEIIMQSHGNLEGDSVRRNAQNSGFIHIAGDTHTIPQIATMWSEVPIVPYKTVNEDNVHSLSYNNLRRFPFGIPHATIGGRVLYAQTHLIANSLPHTLSQDFVRTKMDWTDVPPFFPPRFNVYITFKNRSYVVSARAETTVASVIQDVITSSRRDVDPEEVMVKVGGLEEYIPDSGHPIANLEYVRTQIANTKKIKLEIVDDQDLASSIFTDTFSLNDSIERISPHDIGDGYITTLLGNKISGRENAYDGGYVSTPLQIFVSHFTHAHNDGVVADGSRYFVVLHLEYGRNFLAESVRTEIRDYAEGEIQVKEWVCFDIPLKNIPPETMLRCDVMKVGVRGYTDALYGLVATTDEYASATLVSSHRMSLCEFYGTMKMGECMIGSTSTTMTHVHMPNSPEPVLMRRSKILARAHGVYDHARESKEFTNLVKRYDATYTLLPQEKRLVWANKYVVRHSYHNYLPMLLHSAEWSQPLERDEMRTMLRGWSDISPYTALELLSDAFPDVHVRTFAMCQLMNLKTPAFIEFLPQIVNCIRHETYTFNAISYYILIRASQSLEVCNSLFWLLYSQLNLNLLPHRSDVSPYKIILSVLIELCSNKTSSKLHASLKVIKSLVDLSKKLVDTEKASRQEVMISGLKDIDFENFTLPINPKFCAIDIILSECKVMTSNAAPLWLVFVNQFGKKSKMIFKIGDDMRVDMFALQVMRVMEYEWNLDDDSEPLGITLQTYKACAVGEDAGVIEVVDDCMTSAAISNGSKRNRSSSFTFTNAFSNEALYEWLREQNPDTRAFERAQTTFMKSCAGYCVATYLLGVGDRHNDNIMCTSSGSVFHIDFGYFFGQKVTMGGIVPKETAPFVLTREFVTVMGGEDSSLFKDFVELCKNAFLYLRRRYKIFVTLIQSLRGDGCIPQLADDVSSHYITEKFMLHETESAASSHFEYLIQSSLGNSVTRLNFAAHMIAGDIRRWWG